MTKTTANNAGVPGLVETLAMFIKQKQVKFKEIENRFNKCHKDKNSS